MTQPMTQPTIQQTVRPPASRPAPAQPPSAAAPWWRFGIVWLVVGGPAVVVVASLGTAVVAYWGADEVLIDTPSARHAPVQPTGKTAAVTARNHAATAAPATTPAPESAPAPTAAPTPVRP